MYLSNNVNCTRLIIAHSIILPCMRMRSFMIYCLASFLGMYAFVWRFSIHFFFSLTFFLSFFLNYVKHNKRTFISITLLNVTYGLSIMISFVNVVRLIVWKIQMRTNKSSKWMIKQTGIYFTWAGRVCRHCKWARMSVCVRAFYRVWRLITHKIVWRLDHDSCR